MSYTQFLEPLKSVDSFHKNLLLLFDDLVSLVKEKAYAGSLRNLVPPENSYNIWNPNNSEFRRVWVFDHVGRIRFVVMLVKTHDEHLAGNSKKLKEWCKQVDRDPRFPLMLFYGLLEPHDMTRFINDLNLRRNWVLNATFINLVEEHTLPDLSSLTFGDTVTLVNKGSNSWHCEKADYRIKDLTEITDTNALAIIADDILNFGVTGNPNAVQDAQ